jgi:hypothetical protein
MLLAILPLDRSAKIAHHNFQDLFACLKTNEVIKGINRAQYALLDLNSLKKIRRLGHRKVALAEKTIRSLS